MILKPHNLIDTLGALILVCGQVAGEPAMVVEEPAIIVEEPALPVEKSIEELFNEAYTKDPISDNVLGQLHRG